MDKRTAIPSFLPASNAPVLGAVLESKKPRLFARTALGITILLLLPSHLLAFFLSLLPDHALVSRFYPVSLRVICPQVSAEDGNSPDVVDEAVGRVGRSDDCKVESERRVAIWRAGGRAGGRAFVRAINECP